MLDQLLKTPTHPNRPLYQFLPVSTSLETQIKKQATELLNAVTLQPEDKDKKSERNFHDFVPNQDTENVRSDLIMLKLKGYMDRRNITGKNSELKKLPSKVQVGRMIEGDPFLAAKAKIREKKKQATLTDYYLQLDKKQEFSSRKFSEIQRSKQRRKKITKKSLIKKQTGSSGNKNRK